MKKAMPALMITLLLTGASALVAQAPSAAMNFKDAEKTTKSKPDVTYGRVKELTAGQKVVIDVDNAPDKSFDLNDKDVSVRLASGLKVGDPVRVTEHSVAGKTKSVQITRHSGGGVRHGDKKSAAAEKNSTK
jgi:hypothetical protein